MTRTGRKRTVTSGWLSFASSSANSALGIGAWNKRWSAGFETPTTDSPRRSRASAYDEAARNLGPSPLDAVVHLLDELSAAYLEGTDSERAAIRSALEGTPSISHALCGYASRCAHELETSGDAAWLARGLAGISMEDVRIDFRDAYVALGDLHRAATRRGINPRPVFAAVAALSSDSPKTGRRGSTTRRFLENFESSAYFASLE